LLSFYNYKRSAQKSWYWIRIGWDRNPPTSIDNKLHKKITVVVKISANRQKPVMYLLAVEISRKEFKILGKR